MSEVILHHYDASPFSEKVRCALGIKGLSWRSVIIPNVMPKPDYTPLTGGYRRTPAMQIGAEVWCDSSAILAELERRYPDPPLATTGSWGIGAALSMWTDRPFFQSAVGLVFGHRAGEVSEAFIEDRSRMTGRSFDVARMRQHLPMAREQFRSHLYFLERQLVDGRSYMMGDRPGLADLHPWHVVWFLMTAAPEEAGLMEGFPRVEAWSERMRAIGHGSRSEMDPGEALEIAARSAPETLPGVAPGEPDHVRVGSQVEIAPDDYGRDLVAGEVLATGPMLLSLLRRDPQLGEVVVHFPRAGFVVLPIQSSTVTAR